MTNAEALAAAPLRDGAATSLPDRLELAGMLAVFGLALSVQFSIAIAQAMLAIAVICWMALLVTQHERPGVPRFFWPVIGYCAWTLVSAVFSGNPRLSFVD